MGNFMLINQIEYWIKDIMIDNVGKLSHLKFMNDDLLPKITRRGKWNCNFYDRFT